jgi:crotonobetainyl-CoA:carnitine CoA-transferase CaiB-like acyl-CoA transferase
MTSNGTARALEGIRVLDFTWAQQGPYATVLLSDLGADIIKVEPREGGDFGRGVWSPQDGASPYFIAHDRGKRSVTVDLKHLDGREVIHRLVRYCDVVVNNYRPGVMERLGFGYEDLRKLREDVIFASASGYGPKGPRAFHPGFDIAGQAMGGLISRTGSADGEPVPAGAAIADQVGAMMLGFGIMTALYVRERFGIGQSLDCSLYGSQIALQSWEIDQWSIAGPASRGGRGHALIPGLWGVFKTADGHIAFGGVGDNRWPGFCKAIGCEELLEDERFRTARDRAITNKDALVALVDERLPTRTTAEWLETFTANDLIVAPVQDYSAILADEQAWANDYLIHLEDPVRGDIKVVGFPVTFSGTPAVNQGPPPELDQHTEAVLSELGYGWEEIARLRDSGAVGMPSSEPVAKL